MIPFVPHPESISPDLLHSRMQGIELWKHHKSPQASYAGFFLGGGSSLGPCILIQNPGSRESMRFQQKSHNFGSSCWSQMLISHVWNITRIQLQSWGEFLPGFTISTLQIGLQSNPYSRVEGSKSWRKKRAESKVPAFFYLPFHFLSLSVSFSNTPPCRLFFAIAWGTSSGKGSSRALSVAGSRKILLTMYMSWPIHQSTGTVPRILCIHLGFSRTEGTRYGSQLRWLTGLCQCFW